MGLTPIKGYCINCKLTEVDMETQWVCKECSEKFRGEKK